MKKTYLLILFLLVLVAFVIVVKISFSQSVSKQAVQNIPKVIPTSRPTPTLTIGQQTKDWKTYADTNLGYQLKYPRDWTQTRKTISAVVFSSGSKDMTITINSATKLKKTPLATWIANNWDPFHDNTNISTSSAMVAGNPSSVLSYTNTVNKNNGKIAFIPLDSQGSQQTLLKITLEYPNASDSENTSDLFSKLLGTVTITK